MPTTIQIMLTDRPIQMAHIPKPAIGPQPGAPETRAKTTAAMNPTMNRVNGSSLRNTPVNSSPQKNSQTPNPTYARPTHAVSSDSVTSSRETSPANGIATGPIENMPKKVSPQRAPHKTHAVKAHHPMAEMDFRVGID